MAGNRQVKGPAPAQNLETRLDVAVGARCHGCLLGIPRSSCNRRSRWREWNQLGCLKIVFFLLVSRLWKRQLDRNRVFSCGFPGKEHWNQLGCLNITGPPKWLRFSLVGFRPLKTHPNKGTYKLKLKPGNTFGGVSKLADYQIGLKEDTPRFGWLTTLVSPPF